ncbi:MAG: TonB family protein [Pseudomonadota bacterium]
MREGMVWSSAVIVSLLLHLALFWPGAFVLSAEDGKARQQAGVTRLSFRVAAKPQPPAPVPEVKPQPKPPEPPKPRPPKPKPVEPRPVKQAVPVEPVAEVEPEPEPVLDSTPVPVEVAGDPQQLEQARRNYLGQLLAHIESHKFYPRAARRRGLQGVIQVSFVLHENGRITDLMLEDGHDLLRRAAEEAMQAALPLPLPPRDVPCPLRVNFGIEFKLN